MRLISILIVAALAGCASAPASSNVAGDSLAGRLAARANEIDAAASAYARAHRSAPGEVAILKDALFFHLAAGDIEGAAPYARELAAAGADGEGLAAVTLGAEALKRGRYREARPFFESKMELHFLHSVSFLADVWVERGLAGPEAALKVLDAPPEGVFSGFSPLHRALLLESAGRTDEAGAAYQEAVHGLAGPVGRSAYGYFLERAGERAAAIDYYALLAREPGPHRRQAEAARVRMERGDKPAAFAATEPATGAAIAYHAFAGAMLEQSLGQRSEAEAAGMNVGAPRFAFPLTLARLAVYLDPDLDEARRLVAVILSFHGDEEGAALALEGVDPTSPDYEQSRIELAAGLAAGERVEEAEAVLKDAIRRDPRGVELLLTLGNLQASDDREEDAVRTLGSAIERLGSEPPEDAWRTYVARGGALLDLDRWDAAEADLRRAVEIAPEEPIALNYLGYSWAERAVNLEKAFDLIEKAVALRPDSGAIVDSLGWAHYQLGRYKEAASHLERAAALEPSDPTVTDHLGDVYWRLGRKTEARYQWKRALELDPTEKQRTEIAQKLEAGLPGAGVAPKSKG